eukprot:445983-Pelagomonas_calceolata.AAC.1
MQCLSAALADISAVHTALNCKHAFFVASEVCATAYRSSQGFFRLTLRQIKRPVPSLRWIDQAAAPPEGLWWLTMALPWKTCTLF